MSLFLLSFHAFIGFYIPHMDSILEKRELFGGSFEIRCTGVDLGLRREALSGGSGKGRGSHVSLLLPSTAAHATQKKRGEGSPVAADMASIEFSDGIIPLLNVGFLKTLSNEWASADSLSLHQHCSGRSLQMGTDIVAKNGALQSPHCRNRKHLFLSFTRSTISVAVCYFASFSGKMLLISISIAMTSHVLFFIIDRFKRLIERIHILLFSFQTTLHSVITYGNIRRVASRFLTSQCFF
jgi:hypothetical protein